MRELLLDVIKHSQGIGIDAILATGTDKATSFDAVVPNNTVILNAAALKPNKELTGAFGMSRLSVLQGYLNFANYKTDDATIVVGKRKGSETELEDITFNDGHGQVSAYRFMSPDHFRIPTLKGKSWDVSVEPTSSKIREFQELAAILSSTASYFAVRTETGKKGYDLKFTIGDASSDRAEITIAENVDGEIKGEMFWPISEVLSIFKLGANESPKIDINGKGALQITLTSKHAEYKYILPARKM